MQNWEEKLHIRGSSLWGCDIWFLAPRSGGVGEAKGRAPARVPPRFAINSWLHAWVSCTCASRGSRQGAAVRIELHFHIAGVQGPGRIYKLSPAS